MPSLQQAAKALETAQFAHRWQPPPGDPNRPKNLPQPGSKDNKNLDQQNKQFSKHKKESHQGEGGQKIDVNALFNIPGRVDVQKTDISASNQTASDEFSSILKALEGGAGQGGLVFTNTDIEPEAPDRTQVGYLYS